MKKQILAALMGGALATTAALHVRGEVCVTFTTLANTLYTQTSNALPVNSLFLVFWSPDNSTSGFNNQDPTAPTGGDLLLDARNITGGPAIAGRITGNAAITYGSGTPDYSPGYLYIGVFNMAYSSYSGPGSIPIGTYYAVGPAMSLTQVYGASPPPAPDNYGPLINASPLYTTSQTVPEPGTLGLVAMGVGMLLYANRKRMLR